jgi:hypothetical protein
MLGLAPVSGLARGTAFRAANTPSLSF